MPWSDPGRLLSFCSCAATPPLHWRCRRKQGTSGQATPSTLPGALVALDRYRELARELEKKRDDAERALQECQRALQECRRENYNMLAEAEANLADCLENRVE